jgi:hypothetical protein
MGGMPRAHCVSSTPIFLLGLMLVALPGCAQSGAGNPAGQQAAKPAQAKSGLATANPTAKGPPDVATRWQTLRFLIGTWDARTAGATPQDVKDFGTYSFRAELNGTVLARHSSQDNCKGPADFDCDHHDLLYIFRDSSTAPIHAIYFDNEGHVIHYAVSTPAPNVAVFDSTEPSGPRYRLSYQLSGIVLLGKFEVAAPGQKEYKTYLEWEGPRK